MLKVNLTRLSLVVLALFCMVRLLAGDNIGQTTAPSASTNIQDVIYGTVNYAWSIEPKNSYIDRDPETNYFILGSGLFYNKKDIELIPGEKYLVESQFAPLTQETQVSMMLSIGNRTPYPISPKASGINKLHTLTMEFTANTNDKRLRIHLIGSQGKAKVKSIKLYTGKALEQVKQSIINLPQKASPYNILSENFANYLPGKLETLDWVDEMTLKVNIGTDRFASLKGTGFLKKRLAIMPGSTYELSINSKMKTASPVCMVTFAGMDREIVNSAAVTMPVGRFKVPQNAASAELEIKLREDQTIEFDEITVRKISNAPSTFDWRYWNSWSIGLKSDTACIFKRELELSSKPELALGRFFCRPKAQIYVNNQYMGEPSSVAYTNEHYIDLLPGVKSGKNTIEVRFAGSNTPKDYYANIDVLIANERGEKSVILGSDGLWQMFNGKDWVAVPLLASWYKPKEFEQPWVSPAEVPFKMWQPYPVQVNIVNLPTESNLGEKVNLALNVKFLSNVYLDANRVYINWLDENNNITWKQAYFPEKSIQYAVSKQSQNWNISLATEFLPKAGKYKLQLNAPFQIQAGSNNIIGEITINGTFSRKPAQTKLEWINGAPVININNKPYVPALYLNRPYYAVKYYFEDYVHAFANAGISLVFRDINTGEGKHKDSGVASGTIWQGYEKYNFKIVDNAVTSVLQANPDAYIILRIVMDEPQWWTACNQDQTVILSDGSRGEGVSYASKKWREDNAKVINDLIAYINAQTYSTRIIAYYPMAGYDGQWGQHNNYKAINPFKVVDYSQCMLDAFKEYLKKQYNNNEKLLQKTWNNPNITFNTVTIPTIAERQGNEFYLNPATQRNVIDYNYALGYELNASVKALLKAVKDATNDKALAGTYYIPGVDCSYIYGQAQFPNSPEIYDDSNYDFAASPTGYGIHELSKPGRVNGYDGIMRRNQKLYLDEVDYRTYLTTQVKEPLWGSRDTYESIFALRRTLSQILTQHGGWYLYDMYGGWYNSGMLMEDIRRVYKLEELKREFIPYPMLEASVAKVISAPMYHKRLNTHQDLPQVHFWNRNNYTTRWPVMFDSILLRDVDKNNSYKLYFIDDIYALNAEERAKIDKLKSNGNVLVFQHAVGYSNWETLSASNISSIVGINIKEVPGDFISLDWNFLKTSHPLLNDLQGKEATRGLVHKKFFVDDVSATPLGRYVTGNEIAAAVKKYDDWTAVYLPSTYPPVQFIRNLADFAKVHIFIDTPDIFVTAGYRFITAYCLGKNSTGIIKLEKPASIYSVYENKIIGSNIKEIQLAMKQGDTNVYFIGNDQEIDYISKRWHKVMQEKITDIAITDNSAPNRN